MTIPFNPCWESDQLLAMPFDQYQRYRLTAELVVALKKAAGAAEERWRILDVGGYFRNMRGEDRLPLTEFLLADEVQVVDMVDFEHPQYLKASGTDLPFEDRSFDVVASCDTLEHIPRDSRSRFLHEIRRVARRAVVLAAPHATQGVSRAERALDEYLRSFGIVHQMLDEHLRYGIPDPDWVDSWLNEQGASFVAFPSGYLPRWQLMMLLKHQLIALPNTLELHERLDQTYNPAFYARDQRGPGYRRVYLIMTSGEVPAAIHPFVERASRREPEDATAELIGLVAAPFIRALTHLGQLQERYSQLAEAHAAMAATYHQAVHNAAVLEGEKRGLHEQLELLRWQNEILQARLSNTGLRGVLSGILQRGRRFLRQGR
ncbi:MAG: hypothetical protein KatS3mg057_2650 [Herpetosiphonaceae bacterium]|nr:MAG: hypothetical protein KatS3mg057_2650 [Herpetosiphonaceae bacterium]